MNEADEEKQAKESWSSGQGLAILKLIDKESHEDDGCRERPTHR